MGRAAATAASGAVAGAGTDEFETRPCKRVSLSMDSPSSGSGTVSDRSDLSHGASSGSGSGQIYRPVPRSGGFELADCAMGRPVEDDDPLTSFSLSLPGTDQRFHHDRAAELIRTEVQRYIASVGVRAGCGPAGGAELCMPQLVEGVMRIAAERVGTVGRIQ
uniref:Uncharacterized protein n=1 Tax=Setaria viridis TaxID=4556 RepID=A0A4U6TY41_SETVI|nr:hypothetical protein SEVIR_7G256400v2 [Setaria viridis]